MKRPIIPTMFLIAAASAALAFTAGRAAPPQPVIAVVDVAKVLDSLHERAARYAELTKIKDEYQKSFDEKVAKLKSELEAAELLPDGPAKLKKAEELARMEVQTRVEREFSQAMITRKEVQAYHELYTKIDAAAAELAKAEGYTMVISSDENVSIPKDSLEKFMQVVARKRMLYVDPRHDITDQLITYMNNQFAASGGKVPADAPAAGASATKKK